jgi:DNA-binding MarR family transcriptional regulator
MGELSQRMMVTDNNVTGITDQLQRENLVEHVSDPEDRRAIEGLTEFALLLLED